MRKAKRTIFLQDLIDRYKKWKMEKGNSMDSDSESDEYGIFNTFSLFCLN